MKRAIRSSIDRPPFHGGRSRWEQPSGDGARQRSLYPSRRREGGRVARSSAFLAVSARVLDVRANPARAELRASSREEHVEVTDCILRCSPAVRVAGVQWPPPCSNLNGSIRQRSLHSRRDTRHFCPVQVFVARSRFVGRSPNGDQCALGNTSWPGDRLSVQGECQMRVEIQRQSVTRRCRSAILVAATLMLPPNCGIATAQGLTGALIGTVTDERDGVLAGARVTITSPALIGGRETQLTNDKGQLRFPSLPPVLHVRDRTRGIHPLLRSGYAHRGRRHYRETDRSDSCGRCAIGRGRGDWLTHRPTKPRVRNAFRFRRHRRDSDATNQHARLPQGRPRRVADIAVKRYRDDHFRLRLRHQRKPVSHRWHEHDLSVQWRRANGARCRFHSRSTGRRGRSVGRVRQHAGRRDQRRHQARRRAVLGTMRRTTDRRPLSPAHQSRSPISARTHSKAVMDARSTRISPTASAVRPFANGCGSSEDISGCATTTASRAPIRRSRAGTRRRSSSRSSRGG